jgi:hypothetical protein
VWLFALPGVDTVSAADNGAPRPRSVPDIGLGIGEDGTSGGSREHVRVMYSKLVFPSSHYDVDLFPHKNSRTGEVGSSLIDSASPLVFRSGDLDGYLELVTNLAVAKQVLINTDGNPVNDFTIAGARHHAVSDPNIVLILGIALVGWQVWAVRQ